MSASSDLFPIEALIAEAENEIKRRRHEYPKLVAEGRAPKEVADRRLAQMIAIRDKLKWFAENQHIIDFGLRVALEQAERDPLIKIVKSQFPGAEVVAVRPLAAEPPVARRA